MCRVPKSKTEIAKAAKAVFLIWHQGHKIRESCQKRQPFQTLHLAFAICRVRWTPPRVGTSASPLYKPVKRPHSTQSGAQPARCLYRRWQIVGRATQSSFFLGNGSPKNSRTTGQRSPSCQWSCFPTVNQTRPEDLTADPGFGQRLRLLKELAEKKGRSIPLIATSVQAISHPVISPDKIASSEYGVNVGGILDVDDFKRWLANNAYQPTSSVQLPGEFSSRGGIIDVFAPDWTTPARIELFDNEVASIRFFEVGSQRSVEKCSGLNIAGLPTESRPETAHFSDFLPDSSLILLVEPQEIEHQSRQLVERQSAESNLHTLDQLQQSWKRHSVALCGRLIIQTDTAYCKIPVSLVDQFSGEIANVRMEIDRVAEGRDVYLMTTTDSEINRVREILAGTKSQLAKRIHFLTGCVHAGFRLEPDGAVVLSTNQLFNRTDLRRKVARKNAKAIDSFIDLRSGDLIVHLAHGIGRFRGLKVLEKEGHRTEHLELEFYGGTRVYLPATKIGLVQKYVGGSKHTPRLARIGSKSWQKQKQAAEEAVCDLAAEMLEVQATRSSRPGLKFAEDTPWQFEFEHSFPYHETPDQLSAIDDIKSDMQSSQPMDRLLCGDVGYGKTEVAMRAAFKAVGKRIPGCNACTNNGFGRTTFSDFSGANGRIPDRYRKTQPVLYSRRTTRDGPANCQRKCRHPDRNSPDYVQGYQVQKLWPCDHRRGTEIWSGSQGATENHASGS